VIIKEYSEYFAVGDLIKYQCNTYWIVREPKTNEVYLILLDPVRIPIIYTRFDNIHKLNDELQSHAGLTHYDYTLENYADAIINVGDILKTSEINQYRLLVYNETREKILVLNLNDSLVIKEYNSIGQIYNGIYTKAKEKLILNCLGLKW